MIDGIVLESQNVNIKEELLNKLEEIKTFKFGQGQNLFSLL